MRRTQTIRPRLCGFGCEILAEWDDRDDEPVVAIIGIGARCPRHTLMSERKALAAIADQDLLEQALHEAVGELVGWQDDEDALPFENRLRPADISARMDGQVLHVDVPVSSRLKRQLQTRLDGDLGLGKVRVR